MKIIQVKIDDVTPYANNPRLNESAIEKVAASLKEYGWQQPIVVDEQKVIIVGHTRLLAAKLLEYKKVPILVADKLTPEQVKAYRLADNRTGEESNWDDELLLAELADLQAFDFDMELTGFDDAELLDLFLKPTNPDAPDAFPKVDTDIPTDYCCPECGYKWSGQPSFEEPSEDGK